MKTCSKCKNQKLLTEFAQNTDKDGKKRAYSHCKECVRKKNQERYLTSSDEIKSRVAKYREENLDAVKLSRWKHRLKKNGLTVERYWEIYDSQNGCCAICNQPSNINLSVDHNHDCCPGRYGCGECVRGLLCSSCNIGLGSFRDNQITLMNAADYLKGQTM